VELQKLLEAGFLKEVFHPTWLANHVLGKKTNGKWRMCVDYTGLDKACHKVPFPLSQAEGDARPRADPHAVSRQRASVPLRHGGHPGGHRGHRHGANRGRSHPTSPKASVLHQRGAIRDQSAVSPDPEAPLRGGSHATQAAALLRGPPGYGGLLVPVRGDYPQPGRCRQDRKVVCRAHRRNTHLRVAQGNQVPDPRRLCHRVDGHTTCPVADTGRMLDPLLRWVGDEHWGRHGPGSSSCPSRST
jgi:hypothetical protein